jgi:ATP-dependent Lhr-like helicase
MAGDSAPLWQFSPLVRSWFLEAFGAPTLAQTDAWAAAGRGESSLVIAPTGSGKTLAAFLWAIDRLMRLHARYPDLKENTRVVYISPLKALGVDVYQNLQVPLAGIRAEYRKAGLPEPRVTVGVRSGDTSAYERRKLRKHPPDILITTPESLYLMLTSGAAETLTSVDTVIVDEIHALAATKRGAHLALSLERLEKIVERAGRPAFTRIGLSATVRPAAEVARFLGGDRPIRVIEPPARKEIELHVEVPYADMAHPVAENLALGVGSPDNPTDDFRIGSTWPAIENAIYGRIMAAHSTIVFANGRGQVERLTAALNDLHAAHGGEGEIARSHHGSVSKEARLAVERSLKAGELRCVVATASLELGIDMGAVDQIIQVDAPPSVSVGLQRVGRAGHGVGQVSRAIFYPVHRSHLPAIAAISEDIVARRLEQLHVVRNPLDILAQQTVAAAVRGTLDADEWYATVRRSAPFATLTRHDFESVLDLLSGKYPSSDFAELRPRLTWDRRRGTLEARPGARQQAILGGGTIPDRGLFRVEIANDGDSRAGEPSDSHAGKAPHSHRQPLPKIGELDEEMVFESRVGDVFVLGTSAWRIREITADRVKVVPAPGQRGRVPFWHGDGAGRPAELGWRIGALTRRIADELDAAATAAHDPNTAAHDPNTAAHPSSAQDARMPEKIPLREELEAAGLDRHAIANTLAFVNDVRETAGAVPTDREFVVERTRDDAGDWQILLESPLGKTVHAPWALAVGERLRERYGASFQISASDDGAVIRFSDTDGEPPGAELFVFEPEEIIEAVQREVTGSALFAARFRECAARALLLGGGSPRKRAPLWQQRHRAARLLDVAMVYQDFPIVREAARECLNDVYDLPALVATCRAIANGTVTLHEVTTPAPSAYAQAMLFGFVGEFIYQGDVPAGERAVAALSMDTDMMERLLGPGSAQKLITPAVLERVTAELQHTAPSRHVRGAEGLADLLRQLGPLTVDEITQRMDSEPSGIIAHLVGDRRAFWCDVGAPPLRYLAAAEDAGTLASIGITVPRQLVEQFPPRHQPLRDLLSRFLRRHGPTGAQELAARFAVSREAVDEALGAMQRDGSVRHGEFGDTWLDSAVRRSIRARSLKEARAAVKPVPAEQYASFLLRWQYCGRQLHGVEGVLAAIEQLSGYPLPASTIESLILPQRVAGYEPAMLDSLLAAGDVVWLGEGRTGESEGKISLHLRKTLDLTMRTRAQGPGGPEAFGSNPGASGSNSDGSAAGLPNSAQGRGALGTQGRGVLETWVHGYLASHNAAFGMDMLAAAQQEFPGLSAHDFAEQLWNLAWEGLVTCDSMIPLRAAIKPGAAQKLRRPRPAGRTLRASRLRSSARAITLPQLAGRWALVPVNARDDAERYSVALGSLLDRYGIVSRGAAVSEHFPGGFAAVYEGLSRMEEAGYCQRGHFVVGMRGAQFATAAAVDQLRAVRPGSGLVVLSAIDPANAYGSILAWPASATPRRASGALVVLLGGMPIFYIERGGRTALSFGECSAEERVAAAAELVATCRRGALGDFRIERIDGIRPARSPWYEALRGAGFSVTPRGLAYVRPAA